MKKELCQVAKGLSERIKLDLKENIPKHIKSMIKIVYKTKNDKTLIFAKFLPMTLINSKRIPINFLITQYLDNSFQVQCLTNIFFPSLNDASNYLPFFKSCTSSSQVIMKIYALLDIYQDDNKKLVYIPYSNYSINKLIYSVNDFLYNPENKAFKCLNVEGEFCYAILTDINFILLKTNEDSFVYGKILFYTNLVNINNLDEFDYDLFSEKEEKFAIKFNYKLGVRHKNIHTLIMTEKKRKDFSECLSLKKKFLEKFQFILTDASNNIEMFNQIISIKKVQYDIHKEEYLYYLITNLYHKIIDIHIRLNDKNYEIYVDKLKEFEKLSLNNKKKK